VADAAAATSGRGRAGVTGTAGTVPVDPALPELGEAFDPRAVPRLLRDRLGEGGVAVKRRVDTKYQPGARCVTTYELEFSEGCGAPSPSPSPSPLPSIGVVEVTPAGVTGRLFLDDPALPWLVEALDPGRMAVRFAALPEWSGAGRPSCEIVPVRYRSGERCVLRFRVTGGGRERTCFGKVLVEGAGRVATASESLGRLSERSPAALAVPATVAHWPDLHMIVVAAVDGADLNAWAFDPTCPLSETVRWLEAAGAGLAELHQCDVGSPSSASRLASGLAAAGVRTLADDVAELGDYEVILAHMDESLAARFADVRQRLSAVASDLDERPGALRPGHGAFRADQLLVAGDRLAVVDLDGFCRSSPARDVANLVAYLRWKQIRRPEQRERVEQARAAFLRGYARGPATREQDLAVFEAASLMKILGRRYRSLAQQEWPLTPQLLDAASQLISTAA
jgi:hypothetical protein